MPRCWVCRCEIYRKTLTPEAFTYFVKGGFELDDRYSTMSLVSQCLINPSPPPPLHALKDLCQLRRRTHTSQFLQKWTVEISELRTGIDNFYRFQKRDLSC